DWSSDVCSSDLASTLFPGAVSHDQRRRRSGPTGPAQPGTFPAPPSRWRLGRPQRRRSATERRRAEVRRGSSLLVLPGHAEPEALDHHRMGSQRHHAPAAQRVLIHLAGVAPLHFSYLGACPRPVGEVHAPLLRSITMSLDLETGPETAVQGELLEAAASPLTLSLQDFVSEFGDELLDSLNRANPPVY